MDPDAEVGFDLVAVLAEDEQAGAAGNAELDGSDGCVAEGLGLASGVVEAEGEGGALEGPALRRAEKGPMGKRRRNMRTSRVRKGTGLPAKMIDRSMKLICMSIQG
jgi:hypothetical protein